MSVLPCFFIIRQYHPDKAIEDTETSKARFEAISRAWTVLGDAEARREYDQHQRRLSFLFPRLCTLNLKSITSVSSFRSMMTLIWTTWSLMKVDLLFIHRLTDSQPRAHTLIPVDARVCMSSLRSSLRRDVKSFHAAYVRSASACCIRRWTDGHSCLLIDRLKLSNVLLLHILCGQWSLVAVC